MVCQIAATKKADIANESSNPHALFNKINNMQTIVHQMARVYKAIEPKRVFTYRSMLDVRVAKVWVAFCCRMAEASNFT